MQEGLEQTPDITLLCQFVLLITFLLIRTVGLYC
jgi:hypothetical protein